MQVKQYRKKPVVIEAVELNDDADMRDVMEWCGGVVDSFNSHQVLIKTLEGDMLAQKGDYIIKGINGEFYPCKPDIFHKTYEAVPTTEGSDE